MSEFSLIDFSIIIPTRRRPRELKRLLDSIEGKTKFLDRLEVIIFKDNDDVVYCPFSCKILTRERSDMLIRDYINPMAKMSRGKYVWFLGDDCEILTQDWDEVALDVINKSGKQIFLGDTKDNTRNFNNVGQFSCFPIISKEAINRLGYFFHPEIPAWGGDKYCYLVYHAANRVLDMQNIEVYHHHVRSDDTSAKVEEAYNKYGSGDKIDYSGDIERIK